MKALNRNKQTLWYANPIGTEILTDEYGYESGTSILYSEPVEIRANISAARGTEELDAFGINTNYSKTIVTDDLTLPITKSSILWIGKEPDALGEKGLSKHNYVVVSVAKSLNSLKIAVAEVSVS